MYIHSSIYDEFASRLAEKVDAFKVGNGFDAGITHGPLIHKKAVDKVHQHVEDAKSKGANVLVGGKKLTDLGENFYDPTILTDMQHCAINEEETFGEREEKQRAVSEGKRLRSEYSSQVRWPLCTSSTRNRK